ncbi:MAG: Stk1 family PASTA domain-containing Ser/Thr kinase [Oscillospiraceae bacterium]|nr:Stk1 family PASTA domain-containing Ser/Thr kinase [Oscillospiraceae bacterium]
MDNFCGKRLDGRYEIREIIGVGGMAVVYKAYDNIDDRIVAIKILKDEYLTNEEFKRRFKNESKAIAVLSHPNIVRVYNVSFGDRLQYIVMEYVDGITLKEYIEQQGVINWKEAVHFTGQILAALQHAHDKGIVHQDVKPQNIMLLQDGTIKVTDFGIARFSRMDSKTTSENAIGSVHYISPEQARGEMTDDKADIYSVGVVMYEMLTGQLPFQSDNAVSVAIMQLQQDPKRPREIVPTLPLGLEQITMRAMQKDPNDRYRSAAEMLMDINEFKRNPAVKFNYTYFVDHEPTKYVRGSQQLDRVENGENGQAQKSSMNKTTAIMLGAIAGIVVLAIVIIAVLVGVKGKKVEVPNFINLNYYTQIENNSEYADFDFKLEFVEDSSLDDGTVLEQTPDASEKVKKGSEITLTIVQKDNIVIDASVLAMMGEDAKDYLISHGLIATVIPEYSTSFTPGMVIRTDPATGSTVKIGSEVIIYVATDQQETVKVPKIIDCSREVAEQLIKAAGLEVGQVTEVNSDLEKGIVVSQSIDDTTSVPLGTKIDFFVSNGIPSESSADITVQLPSIQKTGTIKIFINNELYYTSGELYLDGASKTYTVKGSGKSNDYTVLINDVLVQKGKIDFTVSPAVVSGIVNITYEEQALLIDVTGQTEADAVSMLKAAGFTNIDVIPAASSTVEEGRVISQSPSGDGTTKYPTSQTITITVSTGSGTDSAE